MKIAKNSRKRTCRRGSARWTPRGKGGEGDEMSGRTGAIVPFTAFSKGFQSQIIPTSYNATMCQRDATSFPPCTTQNRRIVLRIRICQSWMNRFPIEKGSDSNYNVINLSRCSNYDDKFEISRNYPDNKGKRADRGLRGTWSKHASNWGTYPSQRCNRRYNQIPGIDTATQEWKLFK